MLNQINLECDSSKYEDTIIYYDGMGPALYRLCKFDNSLKFFDESLKTEPNNKEILTNKGSALGKLGFYSEAIIYYDKALRIDSSFLPAINNKANALVNLDKFDEAEALYNLAIGKNSDFEIAKKNLSILKTEMSKEIIDKTQPIIQKSDIPGIEKPKTVKSPSPPSSNDTDFFNEISSAFSSLSSLFGFFNQ